jgi:hypothetical protein
MKARLYFDVEFDGRKTDAESPATAMDNVVKCGMSALGDCWDEYGGGPRVSGVMVLDTDKAVELADQLDLFMDGQDDELGEFLKPVRDFLRQVALGGQDV